MDIRKDQTKCGVHLHLPLSGGNYRYQCPSVVNLALASCWMCSPVVERGESGPAGTSGMRLIAPAHALGIGLGKTSDASGCSCEGRDVSFDNQPEGQTTSTYYLPTAATQAATTAAPFITRLPCRSWPLPRGRGGRGPVGDSTTRSSRPERRSFSRQ